MTVVRFRIIAEGEVQGVGYRYHVARVARRLHIPGQVANMEDGRVGILVEGEEGILRDFIKAVDIQKPPINVKKTEVFQEEPMGEFKTFKIVTGGLIDEMVEGFSTESSYFQVMFEKQELMLEKQDLMLEKQDEIAGEIRGLRMDLRSILEERFKKIEEDIGAIKRRIGMI
jgi:acylphosphatase